MNSCLVYSGSERVVAKPEVTVFSGVFQVSGSREMQPQIPRLRSG
jgi:hypothetical protein